MMNENWHHARVNVLQRKLIGIDLERWVYICCKAARIEADMEGRAYSLYCPLEFERK